MRPRRTKRIGCVVFASAWQLRLALCGVILLAAARTRAADQDLTKTAATQPDEEGTNAPGEAEPNVNPAAVPRRPAPLIEVGDRFFGAGPLQHGFKLPTGAVWTPNFTVFG